MSWCDGTELAGFDTESTAPDPMVARLVTADVASMDATTTGEQAWLVAVDEPIPAEATAIHGISTEHAQAAGRPLADVVVEVSDCLTRAWSQAIPVVIYNAPYDLTLLNQERFRCGLAPLGFSETATPILDPMVIDRALDKYRRGSRTLGSVCKHYGVTLTDAHTSSADALAAVQVMLRMAEVFPQLKRQSLQALYRMQAVWRAQWADNYQVYLRNKMASEGASQQEILDTVIDHSWPVRMPVEGPMRVGGRQR